MNPGDVVKLKSGGPAMTVICNTENKYKETQAEKEQVRCIYFMNGVNVPLYTDVPRVALVRVEVANNDGIIC